MQNNRVAAIVGSLVILLALGVVVLVAHGGYDGKPGRRGGHAGHTASPSRGSTHRTGPGQTLPSDLPTLPSGATDRFTFRIGTLNWRGSSHYHHDPHPGERPYYARAPHMIAKVNASGISVAGFQEFEGPQAAYFLKHTRGAWQIVPGRRNGGKRVDTRDAIAYRTADWRFLGVRYVDIAYAGTSHVQIPLAHLGSTHGTWSIWVLNTHNPVSGHGIGGTTSRRADDVQIEATVLRNLARRSPGTGVFFTGDMNSKTAFRDLFLATAGKGWKTAEPGATDMIDWIVGGPGVSFGTTVIDRSTRDNAVRYTDHPFVHTTVTRTPGYAGPR